MGKVCIFTSKAVSLRNVGRDIAKVCEAQGHVPRMFNYLIPPTDIFRMCDSAIFLMTFSPVWIGTWLTVYRDITIGKLKGRKWVPAIFYVTVEGRPKKHMVKPWMGRNIRYVAVSNYVKDKLESAGLPVESVVHHGVDFEAVNEALKLVPSVRKHLEKILKTKVIASAVLSPHRRKGIEELLNAWNIVREKSKDVGLYLLTPKDVVPPDGCYVDNKYGELSKAEVLALMGASDITILPSLSEGFGLPLIESNAMGTPVVHCLYPPLTEITNEGNFTFPYDKIQYYDCQEGIEYEFHRYNINNLAEAILEAADLALNKKDEMADRRAKVREHSKGFDIMKLYPKLLSLLK